jgi:tetratricopeptide (TPR) repeat protein
MSKFTVKTLLVSVSLFCVAGAAVGAGQNTGSQETAPAKPSNASLTDAAVKSAAADAAKHPSSADTWVRFGDALMQKGRETADAAYCGRAEKAYGKALELNSSNVQALAGMAWVTGVRHEFEASVDWARKALKLDPNNLAAYGLLGDAAVEMGDYDQAFEQYQKMLDLRPDLSSYGRSAHLLQLTGDFRKAGWLMNKAIQAGSPFAENTAWCRAQLAFMLFAQGAFVPAEQLLTEGLRYAGEDYRLLAAMGKVKAARKDYAAAIDYYRRSVEIAPQQDVVAALGDVYALAGKPEDAAREYALVESIARLNKANGVKGDMLTAKFYADHDRNLPEALKLAEEEYQTRRNVYMADTLAWCYFKNGRLDEAKRYITTALSHSTPEASFLYHKGMIYAQAGDRARAQLALYQAMSLNPNFDPMQTPIAEKTLADLGSKPPVAAAVTAKR